MTIQSTIIQDLIRSYTNECNTKCILPYQHDVITYLSPHLRSQKTYIEELSKHKMSKAILSIYQLEYERVTYFMALYLKKRLKKINAYRKYISNINYLSTSERRYLEGILEYEKKNEDGGGPVSLAENQSQELDEYVGFYVLCETKSIVMDGNPLEIRYGDVFVCSLSDVFDLLLTNDIVLL